MMDRLLAGRRLSEAARAHLMAHPWPGNLRELKNVLDYAASMSTAPTITSDDLPELQASPPAMPPRPTPRMAPAAGDADADTEALLRALQLAHWNVSEVARRTGLAHRGVGPRPPRHAGDDAG